MILKKFLCLSLVAGMILLVGCEDKQKGSVSVEYGNVTISMSDGLPFPIEFDNKFISDEEASVVVNYYSSIISQDEELSEKCSYPDYLDFLAKEYQFDSVKSFLKSNYDTIGGVLGVDDYQIKNIKITDCIGEGDNDVYSYFSDMDELLDEASAGTSSKIKSRKLVSADIVCTSDGKDISLTEKAGEQKLYIYNIDGKPYVL